MYMLFQHYFFKSLFHKSSCTISWKRNNLYQIYNISPFLIRYNNSLKAPCAQIKNLIYSVKIWQIHKYNWKNDCNLKFISCTRLKTYYSDLNLVHQPDLASTGCNYYSFSFISHNLSQWQIVSSSLSKT